MRARRIRAVRPMAAPVSAIIIALGCAPSAENGVAHENGADATDIAKEALLKGPGRFLQEPREEEIIVGNTGPKGGRARPENPFAPEKGEFRQWTSTNPGAPEKSSGVTLFDQSEEVVGPEAGIRPTNPKGVANAKEIASRGPKREKPEPPSTESHGWLRLHVTATDISLQNLLFIPGPLQPSTTIDGPYLFVVRVRGDVVQGGSFLDPLIAHNYRPGDEPHGVLSRDQGTAHISVTSDILEPATLAKTRFEFYRLGPSIQYTTPLTLATLPDLIARSTLIDVVNGQEVMPFVTQQPPGPQVK